MTRDECRARYPGLTGTQLAALFGDERALEALWTQHRMRQARARMCRLIDIAKEHGASRARVGAVTYGVLPPYAQARRSA